MLALRPIRDSGMNASEGINSKIHVAGLFSLGTSFGSDGNILTSHLNFLRIVSTRGKGFVHVGLIKLKSGSDVNGFMDKLRAHLPKDVRVMSKADYINFDMEYWQSSFQHFQKWNSCYLYSMVKRLSE